MRINYDILFITKLRPVTYLEVEYRNFGLCIRIRMLSSNRQTVPAFVSLWDFFSYLKLDSLNQFP